MAIVAGVLATFSPARPTGQPGVDAVLVAVSVAAVVHAAASAPRWIVVGAALVATLAASAPAPAVAGVLAAVIAWWAGRRPSPAGPVGMAASAAISVNVLCRLHVDWFLGSSTLIAATVAIVVFLTGIWRRPIIARALALAATAIVVMAMVGVTGAFALTARDARPALHDGQTELEDGIRLLGSGELVAARQLFEAASASFEDAHRSLERPWVLAAAVVPVVAQHRRVAVEMSTTGARTSAQIAGALARLDLRSVDPGAFDLHRLDQLGEPFADVDAALDELRRVVAVTSSPWLVSEVSEELFDLGAVLDADGS